MAFCDCGQCGLEVKPGRHYIRGHHTRGAKYIINFQLKICLKCNNSYLPTANGQKQCKSCHDKRELCGCDCGGYANPGCKYIINHHYVNWISPMKGRHHTDKAKDLQSKALLGKPKSLESLEKRMKTQTSLEYRRLMKELASRPEAIEKSRNNMIKLLEEGKLGWAISSHKFGESYPEKLYREFLEFWGYIKNCCFFQEYKVGRYWLDFAFLDDMRYVEIDGKQHLTEKAIKYDKTRDEYLHDLGWVVVRFPVKDLFKFFKEIGFV